MYSKKERKALSKEEALDLMQKYCAYQERCHAEVRTRLIEHKVYGDDLEDVISDLILDNYLNEERFATAYARGKFRMKGWGRTKIIRELKFRKISPYCIKKAMKEIDQDEYYQKLLDLLSKKLTTVTEKNIYKKRNKLTQFALQKGYEYEFIKMALQELL